MKKMKTFGRLLPCFLIAVSMMLTGCTDDKYDLGHLDKTIALGSDEGFALPGNNSTREIALNDLFDIDTTGCIKIDATTGQYVFRQEGDDVKATSTSVDPITLISDKENIHPFTVTVPINIKELLKNSGHLARTPRKASPEEITYKISTFDFRQEGQKDVVWLDEAESKSHFNLKIIFSDDIKRVLKSFSGLTIDLPDFLRLTNIKKDGTSITAGDGNSIDLGQITPSNDLVLEADVEKLVFSSEQQMTSASDEYLVCCDDSLAMSGSVNIIATYDNNIANINVTEALDIVKQQLTGQHGDFDLSISSELDMDNFDIISATGRFQPTIKMDNIGSIEIGDDVPDFLNDPEVTINIDNPVVTLNLTSDFGIDGLIDGVLTSTMNDGETVALQIDDIRVRKNATSNVMVCAKNPDPDTYSEATGWQVIEKGQQLRDLIKKIPERIDFSCVATADHGDVGVIEMGKEYHIQPSYSVEAPLALNIGSKIVYTDELDGWNDDLKDLELSGNTTITMTSSVTNGSPLALKVDVTPFDVNKKSLSSEISIAVETSESDNTIPASGKSATLTITIQQLTKGAFKKLDGVTFKATAISQKDGEVLNSGTGTETTSQTLKLDDISIMVKGKVEVDLDDDDDD